MEGGDLDAAAEAADGEEIPDLEAPAPKAATPAPNVAAANVEAPAPEAPAPEDAAPENAAPEDAALDAAAPEAAKAPPAAAPVAKRKSTMDLFRESQIVYHRHMAKMLKLYIKKLWGWQVQMKTRCKYVYTINKYVYTMPCNYVFCV